MICYFSGTGNSRYTAELIASITGNDLTDMGVRIKEEDVSALSSESEPFIFVTPTYAWRIPRIVEKHIRNTEFKGNTKVYFILTCGDSIHNAAHYLKKLCTQMGFEYMGMAGIVMPENYIAMFDTIRPEQAVKMIQQAQPQIREIGERIKRKEQLLDQSAGMRSKIYSGIVNQLFYPLCVHAKAFWVKESCTGCGLCKKQCPLNNIDIKEKRPVWDKRCTNCMACIGSCPIDAIEYGKKSTNRYKYNILKLKEEIK